MKKLLCTLGIFLCVAGANAQSSDNKNNVSGGFGFTEYAGHLGTVWGNFDEEWYGVLRLTYSRYLNPSFDALGFVTTGDFGRCYDGPLDTTKLNFRTRLTVVGLSLKYKFTNGYIFKEDAKLSPFVYAGAAIDFARDLWHQGITVNVGNYVTLNFGLGLCWNVTTRFQFIYNCGFGYFTTNAMTFDYNRGDAKDTYMQNSLSIGYNF